MKRIPLRTVADPNLPATATEPELAVMKWDDMIRQVLRWPTNRQQGADMDEIRKSLRVLDALDKAEGNELYLEDSDWALLKEKVEAMRWAIVDTRLVQFFDDIQNAHESAPPITSQSNGTSDKRSLAASKA